jgi:septal ring factor EnvC (AmiA/AmiB activator)
MNKHWQSAVEVIARWRRNRPKAVADAISGSASYELIQEVSGAIELAAGEEAAPLIATADDLNSTVQQLAAEKKALEAAKAKLQNELEDLKTQHDRLQGDLAPGATAEDSRANCDTCGDKGYEEFDMQVIPCRSCVGG